MKISVYFNGLLTKERKIFMKMFNVKIDEYGLYLKIPKIVCIIILWFFENKFIWMIIFKILAPYDSKQQ